MNPAIPRSLAMGGILVAVAACVANFYSVGVPFVVSPWQQESDKAAVLFGVFAGGLAVALGAAAMLTNLRGPKAVVVVGAAAATIGLLILIVTVLAPKTHLPSARFRVGAVPNRRAALDAERTFSFNVGLYWLGRSEHER